MTKNEIINKLHNQYSEFSNYILSLDEEEYLFSYNDVKWTPGQQNKHLILSTRPLAFALLLPGWLLILLFGKAKRPSKTYNGLVKKYKSRLKLGGRATRPFIPSSVDFSQKEKLSFQLLQTIQTIIKRLKNFSDEQLEEIILPHPLIGKLTLKEMLYFTAHHAQHHLDIIKKQLNSKKNIIAEN